MNTKKEIKNRLELLMGEKKPFAFARDCKIPASTLRCYLKGERAAKTENLAKIADALGISRTWLITGEGQMRATDTPPVMMVQENTSAYRAASPINQELLDKTQKVLESGTIYAEALRSNIEAFHKGVEDSGEMSGLKQEVAAVRREVKEMREIKNCA